MIHLINKNTPITQLTQHVIQFSCLKRKKVDILIELLLIYQNFECGLKSLIIKDKTVWFNSSKEKLGQTPH